MKTIISNTENLKSNGAYGDLMETVTLKRTSTNAFETLGDLIYKDAIVAKTLELPYSNNVHRVSCIPKGRYKVVRRTDISGLENIILYPPQIIKDGTFQILVENQTGEDDPTIPILVYKIYMK